MRVLAGSELKDLEPLLSDTKREMGLARELLDTKMKDVIRYWYRKDFQASSLLRETTLEVLWENGRAIQQSRRQPSFYRT